MKDVFGSEIELGAIAAYGSASDCSGVEVGIITKISPQNVGFNGGTATKPKRSIVILTEQVKLVNPEKYASLIKKYSHLINDSSNINNAAKDKIEYELSLYYNGVSWSLMLNKLTNSQYDRRDLREGYKFVGCVTHEIAGYSMTDELTFSRWHSSPKRDRLKKTKLKKLFGELPSESVIVYQCGNKSDMINYMCNLGILGVNNI